MYLEFAPERDLNQEDGPIARRAYCDSLGGRWQAGELIFEDSQIARLPIHQKERYDLYRNLSAEDSGQLPYGLDAASCGPRTIPTPGNEMSGLQLREASVAFSCQEALQPAKKCRLERGLPHGRGAPLFLFRNDRLIDRPRQIARYTFK